MTTNALGREANIFKEDDADRIKANRRSLRLWLLIVLFALFALILVGGATRLTESGLSITEWKPIHGIIPPLSASEWDEEFKLYQQIPQYKQVNSTMNLAQFKQIFWWEWAHRFIARAIGLIFALPLLFFWLTGRIERRLKAPLLGILALGGLQGFIGWWMVASGLSARVDVSQYRLATHLTLACLIFAAVTWLYRAISEHSGTPRPSSGLKNMAVLMTGLVFLQIYLGALVAGLDAGMAYNSWPLMDGAFIPDGLTLLNPLWLNAFENAKAVQFLHRANAYILWLVVVINMIATLKNMGGTTHANRAVVLFFLVTFQGAVGIVTLIWQVPIGWALAHQATAILLLGFAVAHWRGFHGEYPLRQVN